MMTSLSRVYLIVFLYFMLNLIFTYLLIANNVTLITKVNLFRCYLNVCFNPVLFTMIDLLCSIYLVIFLDHRKFSLILESLDLFL